MWPCRFCTSIPENVARSDFSVIAIIGLGAFVAYAVSQAAQASQAPGATSDTPDSLPIDPWGTSGSVSPSGATTDQKAWALLATIRTLESGGDYSIINGGAHFSDFSKHPNRVVPPGTSTAAGAYQITYPTWLDFSRKAGLTDFSPISQDIAAYEILASTGAVDALAANNAEYAVSLASQRWAALNNTQVALNDFYNRTFA